MVIKLMINNLFEMPIWMRFLPILGIVAPLLAVVTIIDKEVAINPSFDLKEIVVYSLIVISMLPIFLGSVFMLKKSKASRYIYVLGWFVVCLSPLLMSSVRAEIDVFLMELSFNLLIGVVLIIYLFQNKQVQNYYCDK